FTKPETVSGVSLVLPGVNIPGMGVLPFWYWILAIFVIALVHEFAHGIVARANGLGVKNTGLVLFGPIVGAFVEPNEEKLRKADDIKQYSVLAAGSFSNILLALVALLLLNFAFSPLQQIMVEPTGWSFADYYGEDFPAALAGLPPETIITGIDGEGVDNFIDFSEKLSCLSPGDQVELDTANGSYALVLADNPNDPGKPFLGISDIKNEVTMLDRYQYGIWKAIYYSVTWIAGFLKWLFLLSLGIGLFNLLPLPIVDGGRMLQVYFHRWKGKDRGEKYYRRITMFFLVVLLLNLFFPLLKRLFGF
ncbi:MAG: M50 family metallopeptidase, partial [Candidatus Woesearchaeota archaeon]